MAKSQEIGLEQQASASPNQVWEALMQPTLWWNEGVTLQPRVGGQFFEPWSDGVTLHRTTGIVTKIDPPRLLAMTWRDDDWKFETNLTITVTSQRGGALISLRHIGWEGAPVEMQARLVSDHREGWSGHLRNLAACAKGLADSS
jgi:uncharacterized protein YndB with AHSA1/START domain